MTYDVNEKLLSPRELEVWNILKDRYGKQNAITSGEIEKEIGITRFHLSGIVQTLRITHKVPVCASKSGAKKGYFLPETKEEIINTMSDIEAQASKLLDIVTVMWSASKMVDEQPVMA